MPRRPPANPEPKPSSRFSCLRPDGLAMTIGKICVADTDQKNQVSMLAVVLYREDVSVMVSEIGQRC
ncbi:MAG: hypothetical protein E7774_14475 [Bradyrhizobium sp.]|nr:MAG: hypothetical protein E7774_14475 [Bradyrhizobium sp.]